MDEEIEKNNSTDNVPSLIQSIISNPEAISKIKDIISKIDLSAIGNNPPLTNDFSEINQDNQQINENIAPDNSNSSPTFKNFEANDLLSKMPQILSKLSSHKEENSIATKEQIALLLAIRPYLSEHRKELIDTFIKMNRLGSIFKTLT